MSNQDEIIKQFNKFIQTTDNTTTTFNLLESNYNYYAVGQDAMDIAFLLFHTLNVLKYLECKTPYISFTKPKFKSLVTLCLINQSNYKLNIYSPDQHTFNLLKTASPGNLLMIEQDIEDNSYPNLICLNIKQHSDKEHYHVGLVIMNRTSHHMFSYQYLDIDLLTVLESILIQHHVKECFFSTKLVNKQIETRLLEILHQLHITQSPIPFNLFDYSPASDLSAYFDTKLDPNVFLTDYNLIQACVSALIQVFQLSPNTNPRLSHACLNINGILRLDHHALTALGIFPPPSEEATHHLLTTTKHHHYLFGHINKHMTTVLGSRTLTRWLRQPLTDLDPITTRHDLVECLTLDLAVQDSVREWLRKVPDISKLVRKLYTKQTVGKSMLGVLSDMVTLHDLAQRVPELSAVLAPTLPYFDVPLQEIQPHFNLIIDLVNDNIDLTGTDQYHGAEYRIKPGVNENLIDLDRQISRLNSSVNRIALAVSTALDLELYKVVKVEHSNTHGHHLRVSIANSNALQRSLKSNEYIELTTLKSGVLFTTPELRRVSLQLIELNSQYATIQNDLVLQLLNEFANSLPAFTLLSETVAELDMLTAFALVGSQAPIPYVRPCIVTDRKVLYLPNLRHPTIEVQPGMHFIANSVDLCEDRAEMAIITGPNMGGKSTYARSAALSIILCQIGCFIPADTGAQMSLFDAIRCRIGASDNLAQGVSTFMQEMLEVAGILRGATDKSFVVLDELGRGTSVSDGFGLAWAICEHIATKIRPFCFVATHFHELTALQYESRIVNLHVTASNSSTDMDDVTMLYTVEQGPASQSFGIQVAQRAGFPKSVIDSAKLKLHVLEHQACDENSFALPQAQQIVAAYLALARQLDQSDPVTFHAQLQDLKVQFRDQVEGNSFLQTFLHDA